MHISVCAGGGDGADVLPLVGADGQFSVGEQGVEDRVVKVDGRGSFSRDVWQGLAGGQVVDGDFVSLPGGAGEEDVATDRRVGMVLKTLAISTTRTLRYGLHFVSAYLGC